MTPLITVVRLSLKHTGQIPQWETLFPVRWVSVCVIMPLVYLREHCSRLVGYLQRMTQVIVGYLQ